MNNTLSKHEGDGQTSGKLRVFITGGSGFIGSHLTRRLADMGHTVRNFDPRANPEENILNLPKLQEAIAAFEPDLIYHLASLVGVGPTERVPGYVIRVNMEGVLNLVGALENCDLHPGLVFTSSSEVYGKTPTNGVMHEEDPKVPISFYGSAKLACEAILSGLESGVMEHDGELYKQTPVRLRPARLAGRLDCLGRQ